MIVEHEIFRSPSERGATFGDRTSPPRSRAKHFQDLTGRRFGKLEVLCRAGSRGTPSGHTFPTWECRCDCGNSAVVTGANLRKGITKGCGCRVLDPMVPTRSMLTRYRRMARQRGQTFSISPESFANLIAQNCHYCDAAPAARKSAPRPHVSFVANGVDRLDSASGYVDGNVVPCCALCNQAKNDLSVAEFIELVGRIHEHSIRGAADKSEGAA